MPGFFVALTYPQNGDLTKSLKSARKKVPQSARLSAGGEVQSLFGQCPNRGDAKFKGASLIAITMIVIIIVVVVIVVVIIVFALNHL